VQGAWPSPSTLPAMVEQAFHNITSQPPSTSYRPPGGRVLQLGGFEPREPSLV